MVGNKAPQAAIVLHVAMLARAGVDACSGWHAMI
jgi:hypothetical protein